MEEVIFWYILVIAGIFLSSCSQLLLKKSAEQKHATLIGNMINWKVLLAYSILFGSLLVNVTAMSNGVELKEMPILESLGYIFVPLLSMIFLGEKIEMKTVVSIIFILLGIIVFYL